DGRTRLAKSEAPGRRRRPRRHLQVRGLRVARARLQHVPRHEPRHPATRRTLRLDLEPQLRRPPRPRWPHPSGQSRDGRRSRHHRTLHRHSKVEAERRRLTLMEPINILTSKAVPLPLPNIDTDQIIPKQFLKRIERTGYGEFLFFDWRYDVETPDHVEERKDFVLNKPEYKGAEILIAEKNFGCGSSREHAAWALNQYGFSAVIAPSFADIFFSNAGKNGIILVRLTDEEVQTLLSRSTANPKHTITIDLEQQTV